MNPRRRLIVALIVGLPLLTIVMTWIYRTFVTLLGWWLNGYGECIDDPLLTILQRQCASDTVTLAILGVELTLAIAVLVTAALFLVRWVLQPLRTMAQTLAVVGPTSLGMRFPGQGGRDEMSDMTAAINGMLDRVADGYEAQRRFAANASHELRTPLATQRALIEVSLSASLTADQVDLLTRQLLAANRRNEMLIEGLLVLAESDRGLISQAPQRLDLLTAATVQVLRPAADSAGLKITVTATPTVVAGEAPLLERLVTNLVDNAIKYNAAGGWITVDVHAPGVLGVSNGGDRVAPEQVSSLFEAFRRGSGERLEHGTGVGLGLTIVRSVVAAHHGTVTAHARPEGGLTVDVHLPESPPPGPRGHAEASIRRGDPALG